MLKRIKDRLNEKVGKNEPQLSENAKQELLNNGFAPRYDEITGEIAKYYIKIGDFSMIVTSKCEVFITDYNDNYSINTNKHMEILKKLKIVLNLLDI